MLTIHTNSGQLEHMQGAGRYDRTSGRLSILVTVTRGKANLPGHGWHQIHVLGQLSPTPSSKLLCNVLLFLIQTPYFNQRWLQPHTGWTNFQHLLQKSICQILLAHLIASITMHHFANGSNPTRQKAPTALGTSDEYSADPWLGPRTWVTLSVSLFNQSPVSTETVVRNICLLIILLFIWHSKHLVIISWSVYLFITFHFSLSVISSKAASNTWTFLQIFERIKYSHFIKKCWLWCICYYRWQYITCQEHE